MHSISLLVFLILSYSKFIDIMFLTSLLNRFAVLCRSQWYWYISIAIGVIMIAFALVYQHVIGYEPCVVCIQVRLLVLLWILLSLFGLLVTSRKSVRGLSHLSILTIAVVMCERSYNLLGTERGWIFGECGFTLGFPEWFAIEEWAPWIFRIETSCGYTPEMIFGITMAETLMVFSVCFLLFSGFTVLTFFTNCFSDSDT